MINELYTKCKIFPKQYYTTKRCCVQNIFDMISDKCIGSIKAAF